MILKIGHATLQAAKRGVKRIRLHLLTDGRDCTDGSSVKLMQAVVDECKKLEKEGCDARVASGGGRMKVTMDRQVPTCLAHSWSHSAILLCKPEVAPALCLEMYGN